MDKEQAEAAAESLLAPHREQQERARAQEQQRRERLKAQRRHAAYALVGFIAGAVAGHLLTGSLWPGCLGGLAVGVLAGMWWERKSS